MLAKATSTHCGSHLRWIYTLLRVVSLFTVVGFITLFSRRSHQLCNWMKYPLSVKSFISLFPRLTNIIKYNDIMVKYPLSDETIWLTMGVLFCFIHLENGLAPCHGDDTASFSSLINLISYQQKIWYVIIINTIKPSLWIVLLLTHYVCNRCFCWQRNVVPASFWSCSPCNMHGTFDTKSGEYECGFTKGTACSFLPSHILISTLRTTPCDG
jgi:hypothetical protein